MKRTLVNTLEMFLEKVQDLLDKEQLLHESYDMQENIWHLEDILKELINHTEECFEAFSESNHISRSDTEKVSRILQDLKVFRQELKSTYSKYGKPQNLVLEVLRNDSLFNNLWENLSKIIKRLNEFIYIINELRFLPYVSKSTTFSGREGLTIKRARSKWKSMLDEIFDKSNQVLRLIRDTLDFFHDIRRLQQLANYDAGVLHVARQLSANVQGGLWAKGVLDILTGLQSITASPLSKIVKFEFEETLVEDKGFSGMSIDEVFYRYPPFEPIASKIKVKVRNYGTKIAGSHVWFINSPNFSAKTKEELKRYLETSRIPLIIRGRTSRLGYYEELEEVEPLNTVSRGHLILRLKGEDFRVWIKYGSDKLTKILDRVSKSNLGNSNIEEVIQRSYERELRRKKGKEAKAYSALNLSYVWYCILGYGLSTDPWDFEDCPFRKWCPVGREVKKEKCVYWSWSRRIFPKIFPVIKRIFYGVQEKPGFEPPPLIPIEGKEVNVDEIYQGVQWNMPSRIGYGLPVLVEFKKKIVKSLPKTNIVGFSIPLEVVHGLSDILTDPETSPRLESHFQTTQGYFKLSDLLITKYFLWKESDRGRRLYGLLKRRKLGEKYREFREMLKANERLKQELKSFTAYVLGHTLAHLLQSFLLKELDLEPNDLIYMFQLDKDEGKIYVLVAENSPLGNLNLIEHVNAHFGSIKKMLRKFAENTLSLLKNHQLELQKYISRREKAKTRYLSTAVGKTIQVLCKKVTGYYNNLLREGLVCDLPIFTMHIILSRVYEKLVSELNLDLRTTLAEFDNIMSYSGPIFCTDGCTNCIILDRGCTDPLAQTITSSKTLTLTFLEYFFGNKTFMAKGGRIGYILLKHLPTRSLIAVTPYMDEEGAKLLSNLSLRGIEVILVTRLSTSEKFNKLLSGVKTFIPDKPRHEKLYIIDNMLVIHTTWNLVVTTPSTNEFRLELMPTQAEYTAKQVLESGRWIS